MKELNKKCKIDAETVFEKTNEFLNLLMDPERDEKFPQKLSAKEKSLLYGIKIRPLYKLFKAYYIKEPKLIGGNNKLINIKDETFPVFIKTNMTSWVCFYEKQCYKDAEYLYKNLLKAALSFGLKISEPYWIEMPCQSTAKDWIDTIDYYFINNKNQKNYQFFIFLVHKQFIYNKLKIHSLCQNGYISQVVKINSIRKTT